jgi:outer membrane protein assembly factor BamE (lipoprotein component of BamABCDE complex)
MYQKSLYAAVTVCAAVLLISCTAPAHKTAVQDDSADRLTVGTVQREIVIGMPASEVAEILGAPNIVTTDEQRQEVWVWDKISTNVTYSRSSGVIAGLLVGGSGGGAGAATAASGASSASQRTLTVIIKFDSESRVRDLSYRTSSF